MSKANLASLDKPTIYPQALPSNKEGLQNQV